MKTIKNSSPLESLDWSWTNVTTDARETGWGGPLQRTVSPRQREISGKGIVPNVLEIRAALLSRKTLQHKIHQKLVTNQMDNSAAVAYKQILAGTCSGILLMEVEPMS